MKIMILLAVGFIGMAVIFLFIGLLTIQDISKKKQRYTMKTKGIITHLQKQRVSADSTEVAKMYAYFPFYTYLGNGKEIKGKSVVGVRCGEYESGDIIEVYYNPENVEENYVPAFSAKTKRIAGAFLAVGMMLFVCGIIAMAIAEMRVLPL